MAGDAERRYIIGSGWQTVAVSASGIVTAADVDSDGAANGEVLTADGAGAATWEVGGGGSLPAWWTVDSTPGSESVELAGRMEIESNDVNEAALSLEAPVGQLGDVFRVYDSTQTFGLAVGQAGQFSLAMDDGQNSSIIGATANDGLSINAGGNITANVVAGQEIRLYCGGNTGLQLTFDGSGIPAVRVADDPTATIGFFGATPAVQQTLDPATCTPEDIANALIALGLAVAP